MSEQTYEEQKSAVAAEQAGMSKEEVLDMLKSQAEFVADLDNLTPKQHNWTERGAKATCENAGHPYHEVWFRR